MEKSINVAILGAGNIATQMAQCLNGLGDKVSFYAVASRSFDKAEAFAKKWGAKKAYGSYEELARDETVDLIYIATPHSEHYENAKLCMSYGRNCLVEKAFCANLAQTKDLIQMAQEKQVLLAEAMWTRYQPAKDIIKGIMDKYLGEVTSLEDAFSFNGRGIERLEKPELAGGALLDLGIYSITVPAMYFGHDIVKMTSTCEKNEYGVDLSDEIIFEYADGKKAKMECSFGSEDKNYATIYGENGSMTFFPINAPTDVVVRDNDGKVVYEEKIPYLVNGYEYEVLECRDLILEGKCEAPSLPFAEIERMMGWMDDLRKQFGVRYPWDEEA